MKLFGPSLALLLSMAAAVSKGAASAVSHCPYIDSAPPVEMELSAATLVGSSSLPIKFVGVVPVSLKRVQGPVPKITVLKYSSEPSIDFDVGTGQVTISAHECTDEIAQTFGPTLAPTSPAGTPTDSGTLPSFSAKALMTTIATLMFAMSQNPLVSVAAAALTGAVVVPAVQADGHSSCTESIEVVVEAPSAYMGAIETCLDEVDVPGQCPEPFPTYPTCSDTAPVCPVVLVGAGTGGLYTAMRMVDEGLVSASDICIFEMTERVGGRLFSLRGFGPNGDLSVDAGGYRTWPQFTPTLHSLITEYLQIPMDCYDPEEVPCGRFNIVNSEGKKAGFATFVETMAERLISDGACFFPYHELDAVEKDTSSTQAEARAETDATVLHFTNGVTAKATFTTILNMPQRPLLNVLRNSNLPSFDPPTLDALHSVQTSIVSKLYLYYPKGHVFWYKLGLRSGAFEFDGDARNMLLQGRYHDGHVECDDDNDPNTCHGFLLAVYANDLSGNKAQFFRRYQRERPEPVTIISNSTMEGKTFLEHAHERLIEFHTLYNTDAPYTGFEATQILAGQKPPEFAVLSTWNVAIPWAGGGWHSWTDLSNVETAQKPLVDDNIFVVNEAYSLLQGWAEGSLKVADEILEDYFGIARPWSFEVNSFVQVVAQTNSGECVAGAEESSSGGGGGSSGGGGAGGQPPVCFTGDAVVALADGSRKRIGDVEEGDRVAAAHGVGIVTEVLVHPVNDVVSVAVLETEVGELVGTLDHPMLVGGEWIDFAMVDGVKLEERFVDNFFNLEVDGHIVDETSSHSYTVHGMVASGLGDNEELNRRFPRQEVWKSAVSGVKP